MKKRVIYNEFNDEQHRYNFVLYDDSDDLALLQEHDVQIEVKACAISQDNFQILAELFSKKPKVLFAASTSVAGIVVDVGSSVSTLKPNDRVAGVLPLDCDGSACADECVLNEFDLTLLPPGVDFESSAACLGDGVKAYTALHYLGRLDAGETVLVMDAATGFGSVVVQLAHSWGAKVLAVVNSSQERKYLQKLQPPPSYIIEMDNKSSTLVGSVMEETGKLGVDVIVDNGVKEFNAEEVERWNLPLLSTTRLLPTKHDIISCLAVGGRWITSHPWLQLDPPNSLQLFLRCSSVSFLFEQSWNLSTSRKGRWLHIVDDIVKRLENGTLKSHVTRTIEFKDALESLNKLNNDDTFGKTIVRMSD